MAIMHPADIENYEYTASEKAFYLALKEQLPKSYHVFYSIRWFETDENSNRLDSECDFLVFAPSFGFITIEVKGGIGIEIEGDKWILHESKNSDRPLKCSPYIQSEKSMRHFYDYFSHEYTVQFKGVYGSAVAFPFYEVVSRLGHEAPPELTIDIRDMNNLSDKINHIFHYWKGRCKINNPLTAEQKEKFLNAVNKRISLSAAAGALIPFKEKQFSRIDFVQDSILDVLYNYHHARILGGAGTGKTFIGIKKAIRDSKDGKRVLFVCCSDELISFVSRKLDGITNVKCASYNALMREVIGEKYEALPRNEIGIKQCYDVLIDIKDKILYDSIIVDEAQDFDDDMGLSLRALLRDESKSDLYVFYDKNQNLFSKDYENAFAIDNLPFLLRYNIRNTGCIYDRAVERTGLGKDTVANSLIGVEPDIRNYSNRAQTVKALTNIVNNLTQKEFVKTSSIVVLSDEEYNDSVLSGETRIGSFDITFCDLQDIKDNQICFKTTSEFKGLEADIIIYLKDNYEQLPCDDVGKAKEYVALTRARYYLYILNTRRK